MKDKGVLIGIIIALIYLNIIAGIIIFLQDKQVEYYAEEYKKANNTILEYIKENYISKDKIRKLIKEKQDKINKLHSASDCVIIDDLENQISILQELLESSDINE